MCGRTNAQCEEGKRFCSSSPVGNSEQMVSIILSSDTVTEHLKIEIQKCQLKTVYFKMMNASGGEFQSLGGVFSFHAKCLLELLISL